ncbi:MAG: hypothetical protein KIT54_07175 [Phycisphaeraceae bacterium]|nr:hypothetical protein [Phycisphaeraceae bacterium]
MDRDATQWFHDHSTPSETPPTEAGPIVAANRPAWPTVIGILLIIFGSIGLLQRVVGLVASLVMPNVPFFADMLPPPHLWTWTLVLGVASLPVSLLHLLAGVQTLRRRPSAYALAMGFVLYAVVVLVPGTILQYYTSQWQIQQSAQQSQPMPAFVAGGAFMLVMIAFGALFSLAWPTFIAIWFNISRHKEHVRSWGHA